MKNNLPLLSVPEGGIVQDQDISILAHLSRADWLALISSLLVVVGALGTLAFGAWARELKRATNVMEKLSNHFDRMDRRLLIVEIWAGQQDPEFHKLRIQSIRDEE